MAASLLQNPCVTAVVVVHANGNCPDTQVGFSSSDEGSGRREGSGSGTELVDAGAGHWGATLQRTDRPDHIESHLLPPRWEVTEHRAQACGNLTRAAFPAGAVRPASCGLPRRRCGTRAKDVPIGSAL